MLTVGDMTTRKIRRADVLRAMRRVPRDKFIPPHHADLALADYPVPIGLGQTTSQPSLIALMIALLDLRPGNKVLEIGTGSGYQTAILAELGCVEVYSVEIIPELAEQAAERLHALGYTRLHLKKGDGYRGWPEYAPFDAIVVTAASGHVPPPLEEQLADGGRLVIPIGEAYAPQILWKLVRQGTEFRDYVIGSVAFVPLTREAGEENALWEIVT